MSMCSKPACMGAGAAILAFEYAERRAVLIDAAAELSPHVYVLCADCAERLRPPRGWILDDQRTKPGALV